MLRLWLRRARVLRNATRFIGGIVEQNARHQCEFCGLNYCLRAEPEVPLEDVFVRFVRDTGINRIRTETTEYSEQEYMYDDIYQWQNYFSQHCRLVTKCLECNEEALDYFYDEQNQTRELAEAHILE